MLSAPFPQWTAHNLHRRADWFGSTDDISKYLIVEQMYWPQPYYCNLINLHKITSKWRQLLSRQLNNYLKEQNKLVRRNSSWPGVQRFSSLALHVWQTSPWVVWDEGGVFYLKTELGPVWAAKPLHTIPHCSLSKFQSLGESSCQNTGFEDEFQGSGSFELQQFSNL